jgi:hypothetical protein
MPIVFVHGVNNRKEDVDYEPALRLDSEDSFGANSQN